MSVESLECENLDVNELSAAERDQIAGKHPDTLMFAWTMVGALAAVLGAMIVVILFY